MEQGISKLTVFFEDPFWVGVYERWEGGAYSVCKLTFGAEPKDAQVWELILTGYRKLRFSPALEGAPPPAPPKNPKRAQRSAKRELEERGVGTKAQQALALQHGQGKEARRRRSREQREAEQQRQFQLRQEKRRAKHKGH